MIGSSPWLQQIPLSISLSPELGKYALAWSDGKLTNSLKPGRCDARHADKVGTKDPLHMSLALSQRAESECRML
jgi:hypothetical protein